MSSFVHLHYTITKKTCESDEKMIVLELPAVSYARLSVGLVQLYKESGKYGKCAKYFKISYNILF